MDRKWIAAITAIMFLTTAHVLGSTRVKSIELIEEYSWYPEVRKYAEDLWPDHINYALRVTLVGFMENQSLYNAGSTKYCEDVDNAYHNKVLDTCYIGTKEQNIALIKSLQQNDTVRYLSKASAYEIVNGKEGVFLAQLRKTVLKFCEEINPECDWYNFVKRHEEIPR